MCYALQEVWLQTCTWQRESESDRFTRTHPQADTSTHTQLSVPLPHLLLLCPSTSSPSTQGVDTVLFSLCHGNNTKPNCPPFCLSTCIYFVFLFSFLSPACTVRFLGVRLSPSPHHSPLLEPIILSGQALSFATEGKDREESRSILYASSISPLLTCS